MKPAKKQPMRQCVGCREMKEKKELVRIVKSARDDTFALDATGRKNGRGAYICKNPSCLALAKKNKGLERSLKGPVPEEIFESLSKEMAALESE
jgi:hypothetical protein